MTRKPFYNFSSSHRFDFIRRADNSANAKSEREKVSAELKAAVTAAREAYKAAKENLDATYEDLYQQEFDKIASEYKAVKKRKRRK